MLRLGLALALLAPACSFSPSGGESGDAGDVDAPDDAGDDDALPDAALDAAPHDIVHVGAADEALGTADLTFDADATIDTGQLMIPGVTLPAGVELVAAAQAPVGPELAILRVSGLTISMGVTVRAVGSRPLVIIAERVILEGTLDAGARRGEPGAGGAAPQLGIGRGDNGQRDGAYADGGGGGGGYGQAGAAGGDADGADGGAGGLANGDDPITQLFGGSGGGSTATGGCDYTAPGAGGGALQLYARTSIAVGATGAVTAGGGGGSGGKSCSLQYLAGTGGGSGGAIYVQSPSITNDGILAVNGGGGGGGASAGDGGPGQDGTATTARATGGTSGGSSYGAVGGRGAAMVGDATAGDNGPSLGNGGGGGGGGGRIVLRYRDDLAQGTVSPAAITLAF